MIQRIYQGLLMSFCQGQLMIPSEKIQQYLLNIRGLQHHRDQLSQIFEQGLYHNMQKFQENMFHRANTNFIDNMKNKEFKNVGQSTLKTPSSELSSALKSNQNILDDLNESLIDEFMMEKHQNPSKQSSSKKSDSLYIFKQQNDHQLLASLQKSKLSDEENFHRFLTSKNLPTQVSGQITPGKSR